MPKSIQNMRVIKGIDKGKSIIVTKPKQSKILEEESNQLKVLGEIISAIKIPEEATRLSEKILELHEQGYLKDADLAEILISDIIENSKIPTPLARAKLILTKNRDKFNKRRKPGEPKERRIKNSPKKKAFIDWVAQYRIDPLLSLDKLFMEVELAYETGTIKYKIGRDTINKCLPIIRKKS